MPFLNVFKPILCIRIEFKETYFNQSLVCEVLTQLNLRIIICII